MYPPLAHQGVQRLRRLRHARHGLPIFLGWHPVLLQGLDHLLGLPRVSGDCLKVQPRPVRLDLILDDPEIGRLAGRGVDIALHFPAPIHRVLVFLDCNHRQVETRENVEVCLAGDQPAIDVYPSRNVDLAGEVQTHHAFVSREIRLIQRAVLALPPPFRVEQRRIGIDPDVQVLGQVIGPCRRNLTGFRRSLHDDVRVNRDPPIGIGLPQRFL